MVYVMKTRDGKFKQVDISEIMVGILSVCTLTYFYIVKAVLGGVIKLKT